MATANQSSLNYFFGRYSDNGELAAIKAQLDQTSKPSELIDIYHETIPVIEKIIWTDVPDDSAVENYQRVFQELESLIQECNTTHRDDRHKFYIVIPVADRPIHLQQCLGSLLDLCKIYQYGGKINHQYQKVAVIVADDSEKAACIEQHKKICAQFSSDGLHAEYFGIDEQIQQIKKLGEGASDLQNILGHFALQQDAACFSHKGAAITRNITYLRLNEIANNTTEKIIFYFIDSDQEFG
ncbi:MAG: hypothetical protein OEZ15_09745 [Gammaproteobacteria bacterium]|nr:hypothetical protein [Gammaproteobacteria bacterium]